MKKIIIKLEALRQRRAFVFLEKRWPFLVILLALFIFGLPYFIQGLPPFPSAFLVNRFPPWQYFYGTPIKNDAIPDVVTQMYPFKHLVVEMWKTGQIPFWNPYSFSGTPFLANFQSAVFHPLNWLFFLLPEIDAWSLLVLGQIAVALFFTYLFARQIGLSKLAGVLSALAFGFCGFITTWLTYGTLSMAIAFLPLALFSLEKVFKKKYFFLILLSLSLPFSFFSGHIQTSSYFTGAILLYLLFKLVETSRVKEFILGVIFFCLGLGLTLIQVLPTLELYWLSVRSASFGVSEVIPFKYLITLLAPDFYGNHVTRNNWLGNYVEMTGFFGVIPFILALLAIIYVRNKKVFFFFLLFVLSLLLTLPTPLLDLLVALKLPILSNSAVARIMSLVGFSGAVLAGFGLDGLSKSLKEKQWKPIVLSGLVFSLIVIGIWLWLLFSPPFPADKILIAKRNFLLPSFMVGAFGVIMIGYVFANRFLKHKELKKALLTLVLVALVGLSAFDLLRFAKKWTPFESREFVYPQLEVTDFLSQETPPDRVFGYFGMEMQNYGQILGFNGYDPLYIQRYGELVIAANNGRISLPSTRGASLERRAEHTMRLLNLMGGRYILHARGDDYKVWAFDYWNYPDQFKEVYQGEKYVVLENNQALSRASLFYDWEVVTGDQRIIDVLFDPQADRNKTLVLEEEPGIEKSGFVEDGEAETVSYQPNRVEVLVDSPQPGLLFLSDNFYPGWEAEVNGKKEKIYRADYSFRAVKVPQGKSQVIFSYQPQSFYRGLKISLLSLVAVMGLGLVVGFSQKGKK